jgi:bifunctional non-homologous end joining protein LigD
MRWPVDLAGRCGAGLTAAKMAEPLDKAADGRAIEFVEWTADGHLRHSRFIALRDDKRAQDEKRE